MFSIKITLPSVELNGLNALDWRRQRGFKDGIKVKCDWYERSYQVDEAFARKYFRRSEVAPQVKFNIFDLEAEDFKVYNDPYFKLDISQSRAKEIFAKYRKAELDEEEIQGFRDDNPVGKPGKIWM